mgnify:CR=1 FL=1
MLLLNIVKTCPFNAITEERDDMCVTKERGLEIERILYDFANSHGTSPLSDLSLLLIYLSIDLDSIDQIGLYVPDEARQAQKQRTELIESAAQEMGINGIPGDELLWADDEGIIQAVVDDFLDDDDDDFDESDEFDEVNAL